MNRPRALALAVLVIGLAGAAWWLMRAPGSSGLPVSGDVGGLNQQISSAEGDGDVAAGCSTDPGEEPCESTGTDASRSADHLAPSSTAQVRSQLQVIDEILASRNDNDPRIDSELRSLSLEAREAIRGKYVELPAEKRAERGMLVFLLGRNLNTERDFDFLEGVLREPPCLSFADCASLPEGGVDPHHSGVDAKSLAYPQIAALHSAARVLETGGPWRARAVRIIREGTRSPIPAVADAARRIAAKYLPQ